MTVMRTTLVTILAVLAFVAAPAAQSQVFIASHLSWSEAGPDLTTVSGYTYQYFADGATQGTTLTSVTCSGTQSPFVCTVAIPAFTPGAHSLTLEAVDAAGASQASSAISFTFVVAPATPTNLVIK